MTYIPINCEFHDRLEDLATLRKPAVIHYLDENQATQQVEAVIKDVFSREGEEFIALNTGDLIRLDRLIEVDGVRLDTFPSYCAVK
jgi:Rho-binding antiterminator